MNTPICWNIIRFPGSNCDRDSQVVPASLGHRAEYVWHKDKDLIGNPQVVFLPGGFSYGDYLRTGAIAKFSPIMEAVVDFASKGGLVMGVCNGFQILTECGLLPGALTTNDSLRFICKHVHIKVENHNLPFTCNYAAGQVLDIPIAHKEGRYYIDEAGLAELQSQNCIVFRYCQANGSVTPEANPNGAVDNIAGICNRQGNVLGMMPHPERAGLSHLPSLDGRMLFLSVQRWLEEHL